MYMNKNMLRGCAVLAILLVAYLLVIFLIPFAHTAVFWVSFVFTLIAFGIIAAACWLAFVRKPDAKSRFYGFPIARIGVIYGAAQLVCGLAFMALGKWVPVWAAVLVYALGLGAAAIGLIAADTVAEEIQAQDVRLKVNVSFMRDLQSKVNRMAAQCELAELRQLSRSRQKACRGAALFRPRQLRRAGRDRARPCRRGGRFAGGGRGRGLAGRPHAVPQRLRPAD